ncbi:MAG: AAA family ATPase [Patescibacteria group bacterium]
MTILKFLLWHYSSGIVGFFRNWKNFLSFVWYYFGVKIHLFSLFSSWHRDISRVPKVGFHPILLLESFLENIFTRLIGASVRLLVIGLALLLEILILFFGLLLFLVWISWPILLLGSLSPLLSLDAFSPAGLSCLAVTIFYLFILALSFLSFVGKRKNYSEMSFKELSQESWFSRVWNRIGKSEVKITPQMASDIGSLESYLRSCEITLDEFEKIIVWETNTFLEKKRKRRFWLKENLFSCLPIGRNWPYAYTRNLDCYSQDLSQNDFSQYKDSELIGKNKELAQAELVLTRPSQNSLIITGEPGVGKETIIHTLAKNIRHNKIQEALSNKRILKLDLKSLLINSKTDVEKTLHKVFFEATQAGNVILVIEDIHEYLEDERYKSFSSIISDYLEYPSFQIIGTTTPSDFHNLLSQHPEIMKSCEKIQISQTSPQDTLSILLYKLKPIEKNRVLFTYQALREIVELSERYISDSPFPEKALDLLEETSLYWKNNPSQRFVDKSLVEKVVSNKLGVPLGDLGQKESRKLLNLEETLHQRVVGQDFAVEQIAEVVRKTRIGMSEDKKPLGSFLFLGPTGVGKTETAKALAEAYFGNEERMIRLDMSEYQGPDAVEKILGYSFTEKRGQLPNQVKDSPHSILLLDEIEKAHPGVLDLFLQVLDEGQITDSFGEKINFRNLIIIATSNAGSDKIKECLENNLPAEEIQKVLIEHLIDSGQFKPEFLNRWNGAIFFHPLSSEDIEKIASLMLAKYAKRLKEKENIEITFPPELTGLIAQKAFDPTFGARAIGRFIENNVGSVITKKIISGEIKNGADMTFDVKDLGLEK